MLIPHTDFDTLFELIWNSLCRDPLDFVLYLVAAATARFAHQSIYWIYLAFAMTVLLGLGH